MEFLFNDLSIHGQFSNISTFREAIGRVMKIRQLTLKFGHNLYCHRNVANTKVIRDMSMPQAIQKFDVNEKRALMQWLTQIGPFWEETRKHSPDDYMLCNGEVVTDTAVGEAAYCCFNRIDRSLVSLSPSCWEFSPVLVAWTPDVGEIRNVKVNNYWEINQLEDVLRTVPTSIKSWEQLARISRERFPNLSFTDNCFEPLYGNPFNEGSAQSVLALMNILERFKCCFNENGERTSEGHQIYQNHFTGQKARFSDSSDTEKREFKKELTFPHPERENETLFCPWHGKVKNYQLRIHFSWPVSANEPLYVVYVGTKITKR